MDWRSHVIAGLVLTVIALLAFGITEISSLVILGAIGGLSALVPDLDHESSRGRKLLDVAFIGFAFLTALTSGCGSSICLPDFGQLSDMVVVFFAIAGMYFVFFTFLKPNHRGITHTIAATVVFSMLLFIAAGRETAIAGFCGYFSHMIADRHIKII
jgi:membrane-bound metal-dependent hydrolase YbcI (DUF457 family)